MIKKPIIFHEGLYTHKDIDKFISSHKIWNIKDIYNFQLRELFEISYPDKLDNRNVYNDFYRKRKENEQIKGDWIYLPWKGALIHSVKKNDYLKLITNRNQNLITKEEQNFLDKKTLGVLGLSNGGHIALNLIRGSVCKTLKLSDFDHISTTNLNRLNAGISEIGDSKIEALSYQLYNINPYIDLYLYADGLNSNNIDSFINQNPKPSIIFEIIDDFKMKINLRLKARESRIPIVMFSNVHDTILIDIERYDLYENLPLFNNKVGNLAEEILNNSKTDPNELAVLLVGKEFVSERALNTVKEIGTKFVGRPQLSSTIITSSGLSGYIAKEILLHNSRISGRYIFSFSDLFKLK